MKTRHVTPQARFLDWVTHLVHVHRSRLLRSVRKEGVRAEDALDCVQEAFHTFLVLPQARQLVDQSDDSAKVLTVLARNAARNRRRRHDRARPHSAADLDLLKDTGPSVEKLIEEAQTYALMVGCVDHLGKLQRSVVTLRLLDEVPGEDVAKMMGVTPGHAAVLLYRAKQDLRSCMLAAGYESQG